MKLFILYQTDIWKSKITLWLFSFKYEQILPTDPAASKHNIRYKSSKNWLEKNH